MLSCPKLTVARITQARDDVTVLVQVVVNRGQVEPLLARFSPTQYPIGRLHRDSNIFRK